VCGASGVGGWGVLHLSADGGSVHAHWLQGRQVWRAVLKIVGCSAGEGGGRSLGGCQAQRNELRCCSHAQTGLLLLALIGRG
jgi:hypothetical protein